MIFILEVYIDEVKEENMIASIWADLHMKEFYPIAKSFKPITGTHKVLVKWAGEGPDLLAVEHITMIRLVKKDISTG